MEKYYKRKLEDSPILMAENDNSTKSSKIDFNPEELPTDPGLRIPILDYHPNIRDLVRLAYVQKGPCQPKEHNFPLTKFGKQSRRFNRAWFSEFANWLEYSIAKDAVFCLCCYLFKPNIGEQAGGDSFVGKGFTNFKKGEKIHQHVGGLNSAYNQAWKKFEALKNQKQHLEPFLTRQTEKVHSDYRTRLTASVDCIRFLLRQGLPFRGEVNSILLLCVACLSPKNSFSAYDKEKLIEMANYYPKDFSATELMRLDDQLELYIIDVVSDEKFLGLKGIGDLAEKMVQTGKYNVYPLVYRLLTLALLLPVVTATVERVFSAMNIVKTRLRNRMGDKLMNDALLVYIEKDIFNNIDNETIMKQFQGMKIRRGLL